MLPSHMSVTPRLNYDVLVRVLEAVSDSGDIARMMRTCHVLHKAGVPLLFRNGINIDWARGLPSFCAFMFADHTRFSHLRNLSLTMLEFPSEYAKDLALLFRRAQALEELTIVDSASLSKCRNVRDAILALSTLNTLTIESGSILPVSWAKLLSSLPGLKSKIRKLSFTNPYSAVADESEVPPHGFWSHMEGIAPHLEELNIDLVDFSINPPPPHLIFPRMKLFCAGEGSHVFYTVPMVRTFPNLTHLDVCESSMPFSTTEEDRLENIAGQQFERWEAFSHLQGPLDTLYSLALQCHVTTMVVSALESTREHEEAWLRALLRDSSPSNLRCKIYGSFSCEQLKRALQGAARRLDNLALAVVMTREDADLREHFEGIVDAIAVTKLTRLNLSIKAHDGRRITVDEDSDSELEDDESHSGRIRQPSPQCRPHAAVFRELDPLACAQRIVGAVATIQAVALNWISGDGERTFVGMVEGEGDARCLRALDAKQGRKLTEDMDECWRFSLGS